MIESVKGVIKDIIEQVGLTAFDDFENADTLIHKDEYIAFFNVKNIEVARWVRAFDGRSYGTEVSGNAVIRVMGKCGNFSDCEQLNEVITQLICKLGFCSDIIITSIKREDISENRRLSRLEGEVLAGFKMLITDSKLQGGS